MGQSEAWGPPGASHLHSSVFSFLSSMCFVDFYEQLLLQSLKKSPIHFIVKN